MLGPIPFEVPATFAAQLGSGTVVRAGGLLKDASTGRIVAHLQETGLAQSLVSNLVGSPLSPISALSSVAANAQISQLKTMIEGLQILQFINLGATIAGIGVSAIGFALMNRKLNGLQTTVDTLTPYIEANFRELHIRELRGHYSRIEGFFNQAAQAYSLTNPTAKWHQLEKDLADESSYFRGEVAHLLQSPKFSADLFETLVRSYTLCNAGRIECLVLSRELRAAHKVSSDVAADYNKLFDPLNPSQLARKSVRLEKSSDMPPDYLRKQELTHMRQLVNNVRDAQDAALSKPYLLETLIANKVDGSEYMQRLRDEASHPILLVRA